MGRARVDRAAWPLPARAPAALVFGRASVAQVWRRARPRRAGAVLPGRLAALRPAEPTGQRLRGWRLHSAWNRLQASCSWGPCCVPSIDLCINQGGNTVLLPTGDLAECATKQQSVRVRRPCACQPCHSFGCAPHSIQPAHRWDACAESPGDGCVRVLGRQIARHAGAWHAITQGVTVLRRTTLPSPHHPV